MRNKYVSSCSLGHIMVGLVWIESLVIILLDLCLFLPLAGVSPEPKPEPEPSASETLTIETSARRPLDQDPWMSPAIA